jgi:hypothetical protein
MIGEHQPQQKPIPAPLGWQTLVWCAFRRNRRLLTRTTRCVESIVLCLEETSVDFGSLPLELKGSLPSSLTPLSKAGVSMPPDIVSASTL